MTATPAKMTVKTRTPTPARRDFRSRVMPQAYVQGSRTALPVVEACWLTFGRLAVRAEDGRLRAFLLTLAARMFVHGSSVP